MADKQDSGKLEVHVPDNTTINLEGTKVTVTGEKGSLTKEFRNPNINLKTKDHVITITSGSKRKRDLACLGTVRAHIKNMVVGVNEGIKYNLKIVFSHFPMTVKVEGNKVEIDNFLGEKKPRYAPILEGAQVSVNGADVSVSGLDIRAVSQTAANIEQVTRIKNLDPRVFQDGIYITLKNGRPVR